MKILKLRALNINSLKGKIEIDFEKFLDNNSTIFAITGAAPVPVPPPKPQVIKIMSLPASFFFISDSWSG